MSIVTLARKEIFTDLDISRKHQYQGFREKLTAVNHCTIKLQQGLPAFESLKALKISKDEDIHPFIYLHGANHPDVSFVTMEPFFLREDYSIQLTAAQAQSINLTNPERCICLALVHVGRTVSETSVNMMSPLVINCDSLEACQVIQDQLPVDYLRYHIWGVLNGTDD